MHSRFSQDPQLTIARRVARHEQPTLRVPRQPSRSEAARAEAWSVALTLLNIRIVEDVFGCSRASQRLNRCVLSIRTKLEAHGHELETCNRRAVPRAMIGNIHGARVSIELAVDRCGVREECKLRSGSFLCAGIVVEGAVWCLHKEVADVEFLVAKVRWLPHGEARRIAIPVIVWLGDVAHVVDLLSRVVLVNILDLAVHSALEVVATVLYTPEPMITSVVVNGDLIIPLTYCSCQSTCRLHYADHTQQYTRQRHSYIHHWESCSDQRP
jgi:hypothetical protein